MKTLQVLIRVCCASILFLIAVGNQEQVSADVENNIHIGASFASFVAWNSDGSKLAFVDWPDIQIWDTNSWELSITIPDAYVNAMAWRPHENQIAALQGGRSESLIIWDATTGEILQEFVRPLPSDVPGSISLSALAWSPEGNKIAGDSYAFDIITLWDLEAEQITQTLVPLDSPGSNYHDVQYLEWSSDGQMLLSSGADEDMSGIHETIAAIHIWDAESGELLSTFDGGGFVQWGPGDEQFAGTRAGEGLTIWNAQTGDIVRSYDNHESNIFLLSWNLTENLIASVDIEDHVKIWDVDTGSSDDISDLSITDIRGIDWSPNGTELAIAGIGGVIIQTYDSND